MRTLAEIPYKEKNEILDWSRIPAGSCELNFRPPSAQPTGDIRELVVWLCSIAAVAGLLGIALRYLLGPFLISPVAVILAIVFGVTLVMANILVGYRPWGNELLQDARKWEATILLFLPLGIWLLAILLSQANAVLGPIALLMILAVPSLFLTGDLMTTHAVYWMTAHPRVDGKTMKQWRALWLHRFQGLFPGSTEHSIPVPRQNQTRAAVRMRESYLAGFLLVASAIAVPAVVARILHGWGIEHPLGPMIVIGQLSALILVAANRTRHTGTATRLFCQMVEHWFCYDRERAYPPWVFQSPAGSHAGRRLVTAIAIYSLALAIVPLLVVEVSLPSPAEHSGSGFVSLASNWTALWQEHLVPLTEAIFAGNYIPMAQMLLVPFVAVLISVGYFLLATYIISASALLVHYDALEKPNAPEQHAGWSRTDGYTHRLAKSSNRLERNSLLMGYHTTTEYPILLDAELLREHMHILGATGSGKTALGLSTLVSQLIRRGDGAVVVLDCKGDPAFFHTVEIEARQAGREFKWFTNRPHRSTYIFNPFNQKHLEALTLPEYVGLFMLALNLHHGDDYGRAWFSAASRRLFQLALKQELSHSKKVHAPIGSFRELEETIERVSSDKREYQAAMHLTFIVQSLSEFQQLNLSPRFDGNHSALRHAIHMPDVVNEKQVVYFSLVGATDVASVAQIAKLAVYSALCASIAHRDLYGKRPKVYLVCDEAQTIIGQNINNVLAQAREHGLACILAHQTMSQLNPPGGVDLRELVLNCTCVKQVFTARDAISKKYLSDLSGQVGYYHPSWSQLASDVFAGRVSPAYAAAPADGTAPFNIIPEIGPRLTSEDISDISRNPNQSIVAIEQNTGYSAFVGAFPVHTDWPISKAEYDRRHLDMPWPAATEATIELTPFWPKANDETIVPTHHPALTGPADGLDAEQQMQKIKKKLGME